MRKKGADSGIDGYLYYFDTVTQVIDGDTLKLKTQEMIRWGSPRIRM